MSHSDGMDGFSKVAYCSDVFVAASRDLQLLILSKLIKIAGSTIATRLNIEQDLVLR